MDIENAGLFPKNPLTYDKIGGANQIVILSQVNKHYG